MKMPFFSVIMPIYNRESFLAQTIGSVLNQKFEDFELICVNDGSTDHTSDVIKRLAAKDDRIKYIYQNNSGRGHARNTGIRHARAKWLCFLDSDDVYFDNHLEFFRGMIKRFPEHTAFASEQLFYGKQKMYPHENLRKELYVVTFEDMIYGNPLSLNQVCYHSKLKLYFPEENIPVSEDWLFMRELALKAKVLKSNIVTTDVMEHDNRTMKKLSSVEIAKWNLYTAEYFVHHNRIKEETRRKILSHTCLLCANILLSDKKKRAAKIYLNKAMKYSETLTDRLFYHALIKAII